MTHGPRVKLLSMYVGHEKRMLVKPRHQHINRDCCADGDFIILSPTFETFFQINNIDSAGLHRCW